MRKLIALIQILALLFFVMKIAALAGVLNESTPPQKVEIAGSVVQPNYAKITDIDPSENKKEHDSLPESAAFLNAIEEKQKDLDKREASLKLEEQRLLALKNEILEKMEWAKAEQEKLKTALESYKTADVKRYKDLAKVFDAAPPQKAGAILETMDTKTAAGITMNMKKEKAGAIWGYISPQKAIAITHEITKITNNQ
jgi:flagellar motility protein MotE (MotC chaperone)